MLKNDTRHQTHSSGSSDLAAQTVMFLITKRLIWFVIAPFDIFCLWLKSAFECYISGKWPLHHYVRLKSWCKQLDDMRDPHSIAKAPQLPSSGWKQWDNKPLPHQYVREALSQTENQNKTCNITTDSSSWTNSPLPGCYFSDYGCHQDQVEEPKSQKPCPPTVQRENMAMYHPSLHQLTSFTVDLYLSNTNYINNHLAILILKFTKVMIQEGETGDRCCPNNFW